MGFQDETWWTRLAQPDLFAWAAADPLRLLANARGDGKEALACYGLLARRARPGDGRVDRLAAEPRGKCRGDHRDEQPQERLKAKN